MKNKNGFVSVDMAVAIVSVMLFSVLIISLISSNTFGNVKIKKDTLAMLYLTETFENIGIADYQEVTEENISKFIPADLNDYTIEIAIENIGVEDILKKIVGTINYKINNKEYRLSMERVKGKE